MEELKRFARRLNAQKVLAEDHLLLDEAAPPHSKKTFRRVSRSP